jgi:uncharacterized protein (TIGR02449 family)
MSETNFTNLQLQVEHLIDSRVKLDAENKQLRKKLAQTIQERASLSNKIVSAQQKLDNIITRLKEELL